MNKTKVFLLIQHLSKKDIRQFEELSNTSLIKVSEEASRLFSFLVRKTESEASIIKEEAFQFTFPSLKYNDQKLRLIVSQLYKALERFLLFRELDLEQHKNKNNLKLLTIYQQNGLEKHFQASYSSVLKRQKETPFNHTIQEEIQMGFDQYQFESLQKRSKVFNFQNLLDLTDQAYYQQKLRFACYGLTHKNIYKTDLDIGIDQMLEVIAQKASTLADPRISIYFHCYLMLKHHHQVEYFEKYNQLLNDFSGIFEPEERRSLFYFALNYCIRRLNSGEMEFGKKGIDIYERAIESKVLFIQGKLSRFTYRNMVMMAIRVGEFDKASELTDKFESYLFSGERKSAFHFNKALINYHTGDLDNALENIINADFKDHLINLAAKTLQAKIYFDMDERTILDSHLDSMEMYIIRSKVLGYHKTNYKNVISYFKKLVRLKPFDDAKKRQLIERIKAESILTEKKWFLEKLV